MSNIMSIHPSSIHPSNDIISPPIVISRKMIDPNKDCRNCNEFFLYQENDSLEQMEMNTLNREICEKQCPPVSRIPIATPIPIAIAAAIPIAPPIASAQVIKDNSYVIAKRNKDGTRYLCNLQGGFYYPFAKFDKNGERIVLGKNDDFYILGDNASDKDKTDTFLITPHTQIGGKSKKKKRNKKRNIKSKSTKKHSRRIKRRRI